MKLFFITYRGRLILTSLFLAITIVSCTTPVEQEETVGHTLTGVIEGSKTQAVTQRLQALSWVGPQELELTVIDSNIHKESTKDHTETPISSAHRFIIPLPDIGESDAHSRAQEIQSIEGILSVNVEPLNFVTAKPVYKVVLHSLMDNQAEIEVPVDQSRVVKAITRQLEELEMTGIQIDQTVDQLGKQILTMNLPPDLDDSGKKTLKQFLSTIQAPSAESQPTEETIQLLEEKLKELRTRLSTMKEGPEMEKLRSYAEQLELKLAKSRP